MRRISNGDRSGSGVELALVASGERSSRSGRAGVRARVAPGARIINVKVGDAHGAVDVTQMIAAINWVVQHRNDPGMNIRVLNLSYGTDSTQSYLTDPLTYAVEQAWKSGIFVVVAAGNAGFAKGGTVTNPAYDPFVMTVGAVDTMGTTAQADDTYATFSSSGTKAGVGHVDLSAPGAHVGSLRDPGSYADQTYGSTGYVAPGIFRGSGSSQLAAVMSGAAALVLQQRPTLTPDQVKQLLIGSAAKANGNSQQIGSGELNLTAALTASPPSSAVQKWTPATGTGAVEGSRGTAHLSVKGTTLQGETDIFGKPFVAATLAPLEANASSWSGGTWNGSTWSASSWSASSWSGSSWSGGTWSASSWSASSWSASSWSSNSWSGSTWSGSTWSASTWSDVSWSSGAWANNLWSDASWS